MIPPGCNQPNLECGTFYRVTQFLPFFKKRFYFILSEREREGESEGGEHQMVACHVPPTGDPACNSGVRPDRKLNQRPFALQVNTQSTEPN